MMIPPLIRSGLSAVIAMGLLGLLGPIPGFARATVELEICQQRPLAGGCSAKAISSVARGEPAFVYFAVIAQPPLSGSLSQTLRLYDSDGNRVFVSETPLELPAEGMVFRGANRLNTEGMLPGQYRIELSFHHDEGEPLTVADIALRVSAP